MSDLEKASRDAAEYARQGDTYAVVLAALQAQQQGQVTTCQHQQVPAARQSGGAMRWLAIGMGGSALLLSVAVSAVAIAVSAVAVTVALVVLRSIWQDMRKG